MTDHQFDSVINMVYTIVSKCRTIEEAKETLRNLMRAEKVIENEGEKSEFSISI